METVIGIIALIAAIGVFVFIYFKSKKSKQTSSGTSSGDHGEPYDQFLQTMRTVFSGGSKDAQQGFLKQNKQTIQNFKLNSIDFEKKFDAIIKQYGK